MERAFIRKILVFLMIATIIGVFLCQAAYAQSLKQQLTGTWKVTSATMQIGDQVKPVALGKNIVGFIMYAPDGYMCFVAMSANRSKLGTGDRIGGTVEQKAAAYDSYRSTCGRYEVISEQERIISHAFDVSLTPDVTGQVEKRFIKEISASKLILETIPHTVGGQQAIGVWVYHRVK
jgi:hypothetical protein